MAERPMEVELPPKIFVLNVDCFEHLFEWLSLRDLLAFRLTCNRMKQVVDYYIKSYYPKVHKLCIGGLGLLELHHLKTNDFPWVKHLYFDSLELRQSKIDDIKPLLCRAESICLDDVKLDGDFYEIFLKCCTNLKYLSIKSISVYPLIGNGNEWFHREYSKLKLHTFELHVTARLFRPIDVETFLKLNPNIRNFSTSSKVCKNFVNWMLESNHQFDTFSVSLSWNEALPSFSDQLKVLYEHGFYKKLNLVSFHKSIIHGVDLLPALDNLQMWNAPNLDDLPPLKVLQTLSIDAIDYSLDNSLDLIVSKFVNLRRLHVNIGDLIHIRPFILYAAKLEQILLMRLRNDDIDDEIDGIDFSALNRDRNKLPEAHKVTIYIDEKLFLRLKWTAKINFSFIELKGTGSFVKKNTGFFNRDVSVLY